MANIIGLTGAGGGKIMVNADQISYMHQSEKHEHLSVIKMMCGETVTVREDVYEIAYRIASDPADVEPPDDEPGDTITRVTNHIICGSLTPGEHVEIQSVVEYDDGEARVNRIEGIFVDTRTSEFPGNEGVQYHYFRDGIVNGGRHGTFGLPAASFINLV